MALAYTHTVALIGVEGHLIGIEADIAHGLPMMILVGLPDSTLREVRDRITAAIINSAETWPESKVTVGLSPTSLPKRGNGFDLAIAIAILAASEALPPSIAARDHVSRRAWPRRASAARTWRAARSNRRHGQGLQYGRGGRRERRRGTLGA
jgi:magnesium chelatase family protein